MAKENNPGKPNLESRMRLLEKRLTKLEKKFSHRKREYTVEEKKAIRARLLTGQETARKKREAEAKAAKRVKSNNPEKLEPIETHQTNLASPLG